MNGAFIKAPIKMEIMFKKVMGYGDLMLEYTFCFYGEPILFICKNKAGERFLCSCCMLSRNWVVTPVSEEEIFCLLDGIMEIREVFQKPNQTLFLTWTGSTLCQSRYVPEDALPESNFYLDSCAEAARDYRKIMECRCYNS